MVISAPLSSIGHLRNLIHNLKVIKPKKIQFPDVRRASVAIILRVRLNEEDKLLEYKDLDQLLFDSKLEKGQVEIFFIQRSVRAGDRWSGQVAFPGGKQEPSDKDDIATAIREVEEEVGIDLTTQEYNHLGQLDDREVTSRFGNKLLMVLSTQVFIQLSTRDNGLQVNASEVAQGIWYPITKFKQHQSNNLWVPHNISVYQALKSAKSKAPVASNASLVDFLFEYLFGKMKFSSIPLLPSSSLHQNQHSPKLWGLTLGITSELWDMAHPPPLVPKVPLYFPLPTYDYPEINLLIRLICSPNPNRKPNPHIVNRRTWDKYFLVLRFGIILAATGRTLIMIGLIRFLFKHFLTKL